MPFNILTVFGLLSLLSLSAVCHCHPTNGDSFPPVNLGYAVHIPTFINETSSGLRYANYNNVRFAQPPLGPLRFRKTQTPPPNQPGIQNGSAPRFSTDCVSAIPGIFPDLGTDRAWGTEDCLFLNVRVPEGIKEGDKVPVVHFAHGSGFAYGSKDFQESNGDGWGLYEDVDPGSQKFIYVASNYRMGLFGWSSSPAENMEANVGLHDAMAAFRWTQKYISKFGGDPERITVLGQSAGAGMIDMLMVAKEGQEYLPFNQAYIASPAIWPRRDPTRQQAVFDEVLKATNCTSAVCLRDASPESLFRANSYLITNLTDGSSGAFGPGTGFTPIVDGTYITDHVSTLLARGLYNRGIKQVVVGNTANEGMHMSPDADMPNAFPALVRETIPNADDATIRRIQSLYEYPAELPQKLAWDWATDMTFACNAYFTAKAYGDRAKRYVMAIPPATHGLDLNYFFFQDNATTPVPNVSLAREFQEYVRRFVTGAKNTKDFPGLTPWPEYGIEEASSFNVTLGGFNEQKDFWEVNQRCQVLNGAFSDPKNGA